MASSNQGIGPHLSPESDFEFNGTISRAVQEGAKFSLLLAMVEQNFTHRPYVEKSDDPSHFSAEQLTSHCYRPLPLSANQTYWQTCQYTSQFIHDNQLNTAKLWLAMHPEPLSQHNNPREIDEDIIANCSYNTQQRLQQAESKLLKVDETRLYDILQEVESSA